MKNSVAIFEEKLNVLENTNTNWTVRKEPLVSQVGNKPTSIYGIFRSDNGQFLGNVKERYTCYQNHEMLDLLFDTTNVLDLKVTNGGYLQNGSKVYYQIALPDAYVGKSNMKRNISALNSHDGSMSIAFGSTNTVVVCQNTFHRAYKSLDKVKHTINAGERLKVMVENLKLAIQNDNKLIEKFKVMCDFELKDEMIAKITTKMFNVDLNGKINEVSTRKRNQIQTFSNNLMTEINLEGKTLWGLFNAVTRYTNYEMHTKDTDQQVESIMFGSGYGLSNMAFDEIMSYIEKNTIELIPVK